MSLMYGIEGLRSSYKKAIQAKFEMFLSVWSGLLARRLATVVAFALKLGDFLCEDRYCKGSCISMRMTKIW